MPLMNFDHIYLISFNLLFRLTRLVFLHCSFPQNLKSSGLQVYLHFPSWRWKSMKTPWSDFLWDPCFMNIFFNCIPLSPLSGPEIQPQLCPLLGKFRLCQSQASPRSPSLLSNSPSSSLLSNCSSSSHFLSTCLNRHSLRVISLLPSGLIDTKQGDQLKTDACIL